ncbi:MAG TPA: hypothetical protein VJ767_12590 [Nitrososphaeraceae archaeon]|nr:hypothetical protein [Nitrososphaeraceae archaeon]
MNNKYVFNNLALKPHVYERVKKRGIFGESFSDIIEKMLDKLEGIELETELQI